MMLEMSNNNKFKAIYNVLRDIQRTDRKILPFFWCHILIKMFTVITRKYVVSTRMCITTKFDCKMIHLGSKNRKKKNYKKMRKYIKRKSKLEMT